MKKAPLFWTAAGLLILLMAVQLILPDRGKSDMENRVLTPAPPFTADGFVSGAWEEQLEKYAADQLPLRDAFVSLHTAAQRLTGRRADGDVLQSGDWLFTRTDSWSRRCVTLNAAALESLAEQTGRRALLLAVPSSACLYPEKLPAGAPMGDEEALLAAAAAETTVLPLVDRLRAARDAGPLYYRTDHHWARAGVQAGYVTACRALGLEPLPEEAVQSYPGFYGSYYARHPLPWLAPDSLSFAFPDHVRLRIGEEEQPGLTDPAVLGGRDKYAALLWGNHAVIELTCGTAPEGTLLVLKDSYANALLPLLARHYRHVIAVDARNFAGNIVDFVNQCEGDTILCVYGLYTLATGYSIYRLEGL